MIPNSSGVRRSWRSLYGARRLGHAESPTGPGLSLCLGVQLRQPGAAPNATIAGWFAGSRAPYAAEVCRRTAADRKGGHLAIRKSDARLILRDTAQTAKEEMDFFTDEHRHPYFHEQPVA